MYSVAYLSRASANMSPADLNNIWRKAAINNLNHGLTGMLLYKNGNFLQVLEGNTYAVHKIYDRISLDTRHSDVTPVFRGWIEKRQFEGWAMAFRNLEEMAESASPDYPDFMNPFSSTEFHKPTDVHQLMKFFSKYL